MIPHRVDSLPFEGRVSRAGVLGSRGGGDPVPEALSRLEESPLDRRRRAGHDPGPCADGTCGEGQRINRIRYEIAIGFPLAFWLPSPPAAAGGLRPIQSLKPAPREPLCPVAS